MTREDIIRMAKEIGLPFWPTDVRVTIDELQRFAALVAAHEREACAKACEDEAAFFRCQKEGCRDARYDWKKDAAMECSLAIRRRAGR